MKTDNLNETETETTANSRAEAIATTYATPEAALEILDPGFTYWSERGDVSRDEHLTWLETAPESEIRGWLDSILRDMEDNTPEPDVYCDDGSTVSYSAARVMWENGEFSDWVDAHGFPLTIDALDFADWDGVEDALSDDQWDA